MQNYKVGDSVEYLGSIPFVLADGQTVKNAGDLVTLRQDMPLQLDYFKLAEEAFNMDEIHGEALKENEVFKIQEKVKEAKKAAEVAKNAANTQPSNEK